MGERNFQLAILVAITVAAQILTQRGNMAEAGICLYAWWKYHAPSDSCMFLASIETTYYYCHQECASNLGGIHRNISGHLVYIYDKNTDDFIKGLLVNEKVQEALIGLHDRNINGQYEWGNTKQPPSYLGWIPGLVYPDRNKELSSVVITANGWKEYNKRSPAPCFCQVDAVLPIPTITCPPVEVAADQNSSFTCTVEVPEQIAVSEIAIKRDKEVVVSCPGQKCVVNQKYTSSLASEFPSESLELVINTVEKSDEGYWRCSVKFNGDQEIESSPCNFQVNSPPSCPENLTVSEVFSDSVTLLWNTGGQQLFFVHRYESGEIADTNIVTGSSEETDDSLDVLSYNITDLSADTMYIFGLDVSSDDAVCPQLLVVVSIEAEASPVSREDQDMTVFLVPGVVGLVLLILVVLVVVAVVYALVRRRRSRGEKLGEEQKIIEDEQKNEAVVYSVESDSVSLNPGGEAGQGDADANVASSSSKTENEEESKDKEDSSTVNPAALLDVVDETKEKTTHPEISGDNVPGNPAQVEVASSSSKTENEEESNVKEDGPTVNPAALFDVVDETKEKNPHPEITVDNVPVNTAQIEVVLGSEKSQELGFSF